VSLVLEGESEGRTFHRFLDEGRLRVGRGPHNDLRLLGPYISRQHAVLTVVGDLVQLEDLGSTNGTFVNDERVEEATEISAGDKLSFGPEDFQLISAEEVAVPRISIREYLRERGDVRQILEVPLWKRGDGGFTMTLDKAGLLRRVDEAELLLDPRRSLDECLDAIVGTAEQVFDADRVLLFLENEQRTDLVLRATRTGTIDLSERLLLGRGELHSVLERVQVLLLAAEEPDGPAPARNTASRAMAAPLSVGGRVPGLVYAEVPGIDEEVDASAGLDRLSVVAGLGASMIGVKMSQQADLKERREKQRMEEALATAGRIQRRLLPETLPGVPGYELASEFLSNLEASGDLYDVHQQPDGSVMLVIGDVAGKGIGAALVMANAIASLRTLYGTGDTLREMAGHLNAQLERWTDPVSFMTLVLLKLHAGENRLEYVNAGHNPPILVAPDREPVFLRPTGVPIGMMPAREFPEESIELPPGALLCLYTDGIPEAQANEEFYGYERLLGVLSSGMERSARETVGAVLDDVESFLGDAPPTDDITLLALKRLS
jgi:sigma-B regulation protein RsbU (phosphoserine phosphatase)